MAHRLAGDVQMAFMRRVEGAAEQADFLPVTVAGNEAQGRICPLPRTT
jgi:hypothetical protein